MMADRIGFWNGSRAAWGCEHPGCYIRPGVEHVHDPELGVLVRDDGFRCDCYDGIVFAEDDYAMTGEGSTRCDMCNGLPSLDMMEIDLTTDPLDIHPAWDAEQQRIETAERLRAAHELADTINADPTTPGVASVVDGMVRQGIPEPTEVRLVPDGDGLPPLAEGSRWDGEWVAEGECEYEEATRHCLHEYAPGDWCLCSRVEPPDIPDPPTVATLVSLIARHERERGCYLPDLLKALAGEWGDEVDTLRAHGMEEAAAAKHDARCSLLAILDELREKGVC